MNVSIVIPAYNAAQTISKTIESVLLQSYGKWEAIVVDDGCTDGTASVVREFSERDARIRLVTQQNGGESAARNTGIGCARYDWLLFLDADDWIAATHLERLTAELRADPALDAVHCGYVRVALDGTYVSEEYQAPAGDLFPTLARRAAFAVHACVVRKSLVEAVGKFDTELKKSADWDLWQRIARAGARFGAVREVLAYYRMLPDSASMEAEQLFTDGLIVLERGHAADPRVPNPHPDYVNGLRQEVESQKFYLLCWCAGLLLGGRRDATTLLQSVPGVRCRELYPDAIAKCIFDAAILPIGQSRHVWERLWPETYLLAESFLAALEEQSQTPDLGRRALLELKTLILKHSPVWGAVIEEQSGIIASQRVLLEEQRQATSRFEAAANNWQHLAQQGEQERETSQRHLQESVRLTEKLGQENTVLQSELECSNRVSEKLQQDHAALQAELDHSSRLNEKLQQENAVLAADLKQYRDLNEALQQDNTRVLADRDHSSRLNEKLQRENAILEADLNQYRDLNEKLRLDNAILEAGLEKSHRLNAERYRVITTLENATWVRLGRRLRLLQDARTPDASDSADPAYEPAPDRTLSEEAPFYFDEDDPREKKWQLRVAEGNIADLIFSQDDPKLVRIAITKAKTKTRWDIQLNQPWFKVRSGDRYSLEFRARADKSRSIKVGFAQAHEPWQGLGLYKTLELTPAWQSFQEEFTVLHDDDNARMHFDTGGRKISVEISDIALKSQLDGGSVEPDLPPAQIAEPDRFVLKGGVIEFTAGRR